MCIRGPMTVSDDSDGLREGDQSREVAHDAWSQRVASYGQRKTIGERDDHVPGTRASNSSWYATCGLTSGSVPERGVGT